MNWHSLINYCEGVGLACVLGARWRVTSSAERAAVAFVLAVCGVMVCVR